MARYEHLPIYKQALDVAVHFEKVVAGFSRYHKYTLGTELRNASRAVLAQIAAVNGESNKQPGLVALRKQLDELLILVRLAKEVNAFRHFKAYQYAVEQVVAVCRQNEGWLRSINPGQGKPAARGPESNRPRRKPRRDSSEPS